MKHAVHIVNGPNLNLLGQREPDKYGHTSFEAYLEVLRKQFPEIELTYFQSNVEGGLIDHLHSIGFDGGGVILNAGGYTHTSVALRDACILIFYCKSVLIATKQILYTLARR